jgi:hypothetical protein
MNLTVKFILIFWAGAMIASTAASGPGEAAIHFLEKVRAGRIDLEPGGDTAISAEVIGPKKLQIANRYERMAEEIGSSSLEIAEVKEDLDFAAVLVKQISIADPSRLQIIPMALVKKNSAWRVAPVPASFENTEARFQLSYKQRLLDLENWMLRGQVTQLETLKQESAAQLRQKIRESVNESDLRTNTPEAILQQFIKACETKQITSILALLGGISKDRPDDWQLRLNAANQAVSIIPPALKVWELLVSKNTLKVVTPHNDERLFSIEVFNPVDSRVSHLEVVISKTADHYWRVDLPNEFFENAPSPLETQTTDLALSENFGSEFVNNYQTTPEPTAELAFDRFNQTLNSRNFPSLVRLTDLVSHPETCVEAAEVWRGFTKPDSTARFSSRLSLKKGEKSAVGIIQIFSTRTPEKPDTQAIFFEETPTGWLWLAKPSTAAIIPYREWITAETKLKSQQWQAELVELIPQMAATNSGRVPSQIECETLIKNWLSATAESNVEKMISQSARIDDSKSISTLLQNIGYEITNSKIHTSIPPKIKIYQGVYGAAAGIQIQQEVGKSSHPFYPIVNTSKGPKILAEIDLFVSEKNSREFLNSAAFDRLQKSTSPEVVAEFKKLFLEFKNHLTSQPE